LRGAAQEPEIDDLIRFLNGAALGDDHGILQGIQVVIFVNVLRPDDEAIAGIGGVVHIAEPHGLRPGGGIGDGGDGEVVLAVGHARENGGVVQGRDLQVHADLVGNVLGHLNVHALILVVPALGGVYVFKGSEIRLGAQFDVALFLDLRQTVLDLPVLAAAAGGAGQCQNSRQQNCHCLFHILALVSVGFGTLVPPF